MPSIKTGQILGLSSRTVNIEDKTYLSEYFNLTEFSPEFFVGKNALVINGSDKLKIGAEIFTEAFDGNGVPLFIEKAISTDQLTNKRIIVLSIYVYEQNSIGSGKILLVSTTVDDKTIRWVANININVNKVTDSKIRFYNQPLIEVEPILSYAVSSSAENNPKIVTGSFLSNAVQPKADFDIQKFGYRKNLVDYRIIDSSANFSSSLKNFQVQLYVNKIRDYASLNEISINTTASFLIKDVLNITTLILDTPFTYNNKVATITSGNYKIVYNDIAYNPNLFLSSSYLQESLNLSGAKQYKKFSYAKIIYKNINTFTGKPTRHKVYRKSLRTLGDFVSVIDETFGDTEILKDPVTPNKAFERLGSFFSQFHINNFWFTSSNDLNLKYDNQTFVDGLKISGSNLNGTYAIVKANTSFTNRNASYLPYNSNEQLVQLGSNFDSNFLIFYKDTDYVFSFRTSVIEKDSSATAKLKFYITSSLPSANKNIGYDPNRGVLIAEFAYNGNSTGKYFDQKQNFEFKFPEDLYGTLVVYPENVKQIIVSDVSIKVSELYGYTGNAYYVKVPFPVNVANEVFEIKSELYDVNSNLSYTNLRTVQVFDPSGSSSPPDIGNSTVINIDILNVTSSIFWQNPCSSSVPSAFNYFLVWDDNSKQLCVMTSSALASGNITSIIGGPGITIISGSGPIVTISASMGGGTGSGFPFTGSAEITGSLTVTGSISSYNITSSLYGTASWAISASIAITASYTVSSSYSNTSSYTISASYSNTSSYTLSSSYSLSSSYVNSSSYSNTSSYTLSSSYSLSSSFATSASYAINGIPAGGTVNYVLAKNSPTDYDTIWVPASSGSGGGGQGEMSFTSSYFSGSTSSITCSSEYSFWHLHTLNNLNIHISSSYDSGSFSIRLVSSGSNNNTISFYPYQQIEWAGVAGFDGPGSGSIEESGSITLVPAQEMVVSFIYYNTTSSLYPEKKYSAFVSDLKTPGLENKSIIPNLYLIGEGDYGIGGGGLTDPNAYIFTINGGGTSLDLSGIGSKLFWGWAPVYVEGSGRRFFPLYQ
jgi:hypothetical protein